MLDFLGTNWIWILLIGGMLFMHLGHGGHGGHGGSDTEGPVARPSGEPRHGSRVDRSPNSETKPKPNETQAADVD